MTDLFTDAPPVISEDGTEVIPFTLDDAINRFLNRWAFNWRGERAVIEKELRQLLASHPLHAESQHR